MPIARRTFLHGGLALAAGSLAGGCGNDVEPAPLARAPVGPDFDGKLRLSVARYPELAADGGAITLDLALPADTPYLAARGGLLLVHRGSADDPPEFVAMQSSCPHAGCPLGYSRADRLIECPCHGSRFRAAEDPAHPGSCAGNVTHGPARQDLAVYTASYEYLSGTLIVDLNRAPCGLTLPAVVNQRVTLRIADYPELASVGASLVGQPDEFPDTLILVRVDADTVAARSAICTHRGCQVAFASGGFACPCHGSTFALDGTVVSGPALAPLKQYPTSFDGQTVSITVA
jgi:Rieske Fe-S protein